ncbi:LptF/LptG family permease [Hoylesella buccalis]|uniref:LptF/LptG family permease n=1 Tax=Hoylesella buccalis TaxID=28127 RepID=UPI001D153366|nr:LptF/LptG family permease [Hoylesella buccalis]UEA61926.1 LptF/LptG family permease [Hoylesella buccalis]UWP48355.1 LptF/LptG family permease [Hoylesella buccalis ATCC 35310]
MFRIKKLDLFIAKQFGLLFAGTFFICQFVLMMQFLWRYVDVLIGKGLSMEVMAQFFWYMGLFLVPQALPLAILLSSLITFGNLGESSELTAIKSAGISTMRTFRSLILISVVVCFCSFYFQNYVGPSANMKMAQLMISMSQKNPELEIPEGIFYDGIPNSNLYVQKKDMDTGKLYGIMIYRMTGSYEDQAIILADSGMLQTTADKKHLLLTLWSGEWFENMQSQELGASASIPYRRETFADKRIVLDYDGDFNMTDAAALSNNAKAKSLSQLTSGIDSLSMTYDSVGRSIYDDAQRMYYRIPKVNKRDSLAAVKLAQGKTYHFDSLYNKLTKDQKLSAVNMALSSVQSEMTELNFRSMITSDGDRLLREHYIEMINKFTLALTCIIFFFIGAPLGAIIRKGGLGIPVIVSVLVFIVYYLLDNTGYRMARGDMWTVEFGKGLAPAVLIPLAGFVTYKANRDSMVFNIDQWKAVIMKALGWRTKRHVYGKEVIIEDPNYLEDRQLLLNMNDDIRRYVEEHRLKSLPNVVQVFFRYQPDHEVERISNELEKVIDDLTNTRDKVILNELNSYPVLAVKAHTRPFERKWLNIVSAIIIPLGLFFYLRMWRFRIRLLRDLKQIVQTNDAVTEQITKIIHSK